MATPAKTKVAIIIIIVATLPLNKLFSFLISNFNH